MCNTLSDLASWATLILFFFYFIGRIITICTVKKLWKDKVIFKNELNDEYGVVDEIDNEGYAECLSPCPYCGYLVSVEGMRNIKVYSTETDYDAGTTSKGKLLYERNFLNIDEAIKINVETGELAPTLIIEYDTMEYMRVELEWIDNKKNGVYSELVVPKNTVKSVVYRLLK